MSLDAEISYENSAKELTYKKRFSKVFTRKEMLKSEPLTNQVLLKKRINVFLNDFKENFSYDQEDLVIYKLDVDVAAMGVTSD